MSDRLLRSLLNEAIYDPDARRALLRWERRVRQRSHADVYWPNLREYFLVETYAKHLENDSEIIETHFTSLTEAAHLLSPVETDELRKEIRAICREVRIPQILWFDEARYSISRSSGDDQLNDYPYRLHFLIPFFSPDIMIEKWVEMEHQTDRTLVMQEQGSWPPEQPESRRRAAAWDRVTRYKKIFLERIDEVRLNNYLIGTLKPTLEALFGYVPEVAYSSRSEILYPRNTVPIHTFTDAYGITRTVQHDHLLVEIVLF